MAVGVFAICRLHRKSNEDGSHHVIGYIRSRVDTLRKQGRTVTEDTDCRFQDGQQHIDPQSQADRKGALPVAVIGHSPILGSNLRGYN